MRISDGSSDVCASDLVHGQYAWEVLLRFCCKYSPGIPVQWHYKPAVGREACRKTAPFPFFEVIQQPLAPWCVSGDRKRVVKGKSELVSVDLGGRGILKKNNKMQTFELQKN